MVQPCEPIPVSGETKGGLHYQPRSGGEVVWLRGEWGPVLAKVRGGGWAWGGGFTLSFLVAL